MRMLGKKIDDNMTYQLISLKFVKVCWFESNGFVLCTCFCKVYLHIKREEMEKIRMRLSNLAAKVIDNVKHLKVIVN